MVPRKVLQSLVFALPLCVVGFAVVMGGAALTRAMGDVLGARVLGWVAAAVLLVGIADALMLVTALGLEALSERRDEPLLGQRNPMARGSDQPAQPRPGPGQE